MLPFKSPCRIWANWSRQIGNPAIPAMPASRSHENNAGLVDPFDPAFVQPEDTVLATLKLKVFLEVIPQTEELATVAAENWIGWLHIRRNAQPDRQAKRAFELMVKVVLLGHGAA